MDINTLSQYTGQTTTAIQRMLQLAPAAIYTDPEFNQWVHALDENLLGETLHDARRAYEQVIPNINEHLERHYGLAKTTMSAFTLGNWVIGFVNYAGNAEQLIGMHKRLPTQAIADGLPMILEALGKLPHGGAEWQKAMATLSLPLIASAS